MPKQTESIAQRDVHIRVMRLIEANPTVSQRDMARSLGISLGAVNYGLKALIGVGFIKVKNFRASEKRPRNAYVLAR